MEQCPINMRVVKTQISHCLDLLALLADSGRGMRLADVTGALGEPKSSVQRLLVHLAAATNTSRNISSLISLRPMIRSRPRAHVSAVEDLIAGRR